MRKIVLLCFVLFNGLASAQDSAEDGLIAQKWQKEKEKLELQILVLKRKIDTLTMQNKLQTTELLLAQTNTNLEPQKTSGVNLETGYYVVVSSARKEKYIALAAEKERRAKEGIDMLIYFNNNSGYYNLLVAQKCCKHDIQKNINRYRGMGFKDAWPLRIK